MQPFHSRDRPSLNCRLNSVQQICQLTGTWKAQDGSCQNSPEVCSCSHNTKPQQPRSEADFYGGEPCPNLCIDLSFASSSMSLFTTTWTCGWHKGVPEFTMGYQILSDRWIDHSTWVKEENRSEVQGILRGIQSWGECSIYIRLQFSVLCWKISGRNSTAISDFHLSIIKCELVSIGSRTPHV